MEGGLKVSFRKRYKLQLVTVPYCCCGLLSLLRLLTSCQYLAARLIYDNRNPGLNGPP